MAWYLVKHKDNFTIHNCSVLQNLCSWNNQNNQPQNIICQENVVPEVIVQWNTQTRTNLHASQTPTEYWYHPQSYQSCERLWFTHWYWL